MTFKQLTQEQWEALRAIRDDWPNGIDWSEFRRELEARGRTYWSSHEVRDAFGVPSTMRKRMEALLRQYRKLQDGLTSLPRPIMHDVPDITPLESWLQDLLTMYKGLAEMDVYGFSGRSDSHRDMLCEWLLEEWATTLGGALSFSRDRNETPYGPLIDFLSITLTAILGRAPGPSGLAKIIDRYR